MHVWLIESSHKQKEDSMVSETIQEKVILIAGATGALGSAVTRRFAQTGARLALTGTSAEKLARLVHEANLSNARVFTVAADATHEEEVNALVDAVASHYGRLDALINTIGAWRGGTPVHETSVGMWDRLFDLNVRSAFLLSRAVLPHLLQNDWGRIVHISSKSARHPRAKNAAYTAAKMALVRLTDVIAAEVQGTGVTANVVLPSVIDTPANRKNLTNGDTDAWVPPESIADLIHFLFTEAGDDVNGAHLPIYGDV
jgi:NAD(P)-dependent dehydrogenase (short-subunit alcohol dehydrogenase family)